jgi:hypothetical protein
MIQRPKKRVTARRFGWPLALGFAAPGFAQTLPQGGNMAVGMAGYLPKPIDADALAALLAALRRPAAQQMPWAT